LLRVSSSRLGSVFASLRDFTLASAAAISELTSTQSLFHRAVSESFPSIPSALSSDIHTAV